MKITPDIQCVVRNYKYAELSLKREKKKKQLHKIVEKFEKVHYVLCRTSEKEDSNLHFFSRHYFDCSDFSKVCTDRIKAKAGRETAGGQMCSGV